jgi:hypothetical protein
MKPHFGNLTISVVRLRLTALRTHIAAGVPLIGDSYALLNTGGWIAANERPAGRPRSADEAADENGVSSGCAVTANVQSALFKRMSD